MPMLQILAQSAPAEGGVSGIVVWVGLAVLFVVFFLLIRRLSPGRKPSERVEAEKKPHELPPADEDEGEGPQLSLKEIREAKRAKLSTGDLDREAILKAREARKGKTSVLLGQTEEDTADEAPAAAEDAAPPAAAEEPAAEEPAAEAEAGDELFPALDMRPKTGPKPAPEPTAKPAPEPAVEATEAPAEAEAPAVEAEEEADEEDEAPVAPPRAAEPAVAPEKPKPAPDKGKPKSLADGLEKTRSGFVGRLKGLFAKKRALDDDLIEELEEVLFTADIGVKTSQDLLDAVQSRLDEDKDATAEKAWELLRNETARILLANQRPLEIGDERPYIILIIGVNGVGKTTTIGKLASKFRNQGHNVHLIAGDTFRAAAIEQLKVWGERTGCKVHAGREKADPSSVVFDGLKQAEADGADIVLVDTAGRLHTKVNLVEELKKVGRVCDKAIDGAPHQTLLVLDANTGQNAINQAEMFNREVGITGIVLTKLDGTAKGGVIIGISDTLAVPVQYIGIGEQVEDLRPFRAEEFVEALF